MCPVPTPPSITQRSGPEGAGVLLTEATPVCPEGHGYYRTPGLHTEEQAEAWKPVTQAVHDAGSQIFCQLWHVGRMSHVDLQPGGSAPVSSTNTAAPRHVVVGPDYKRVKCSPPRALPTDEISNVVASYRRACELAEVAGFDGVQIHGANGYLVEQFLRSGINDRTDAYGGSLENRMRFALEVTDAAISVLGADRVGFRVSPIYADVNEDRGEPDVMGTYGLWPMPWPNGTCTILMWWKASWSESASLDSMPSAPDFGRLLMVKTASAGTWRGEA